MIRKQMSAAILAPLARTARGLVECADLVRTCTDLQCIGLPQGERIHRSCRPVTTRFTMAVAHCGGRASYFKLYLPAETAAFIYILVAHDMLHLLVIRE